MISLDETQEQNIIMARTVPLTDPAVSSIKLVKNKRIKFDRLKTEREYMYACDLLGIDRLQAHELAFVAAVNSVAFINLDTGLIF